MYRKDGMTFPINCRVAAAIGWTNIQSIGVRGGVEKWVGRRPDGPRWNDAINDVVMFESIPDFEHDWAATGPLLQRFGINALHSAANVRPCANHPSLSPEEAREQEVDILPAVCRIIIALMERKQ